MREAARGGADVDADTPLGRDGEGVEGVDELVSTPADELRARGHAQVGAGGDEDARLVHALSVDGDGAGQQEARRLFPAVAQAPRHQGHVYALLDLRLTGTRSPALRLRYHPGKRLLHRRLLHAGSFLQPVMRSRNSSASRWARSRLAASATT